MMDTIDALMVLLFPLLDSIPFTLPRYWQFRDKLRLPFRYIVALQLGLGAIYSGVFYAINLGGYESAAQWTTVMRYSFLLIFLALAFLLIKDSFPKLMFTYLLLLAWSFFVMGNANYIESRFFWDFSEQHPYLVYNIARIVIYLITCPFLLHFFSHTVSYALQINDKALWRHLWKIPLFSTLFGMLYCTVTDVYASASWQFLVSRYLMLFGACYVSYVALRVLDTSRTRMQLEESLKYADRNLAAQKKHFDALAAHMDETRKASHDLRHQLTVIRNYSESGDNSKLTDYLDTLIGSTPDLPGAAYCENTAVNAIVSHYAALAEKSGIKLSAKLIAPEHMEQISDTNLCVIFGNLLENAIEACNRMTDGVKFIRLNSRLQYGTLTITMDNSFDGKVTTRDGKFLSRKRSDFGTGIASITTVAEKHGGGVSFETEGLVFKASVYVRA